MLVIHWMNKDINMKLAWLIYNVEGTIPEIVFEEPSYHWPFKIVPIVYCELKE